MREDALQPAQLDSPDLKVGAYACAGKPCTMTAGWPVAFVVHYQMLKGLLPTTLLCPSLQVVDVGGGTGFCTQVGAAQCAVAAAFLHELLLLLLCKVYGMLSGILYSDGLHVARQCQGGLRGDSIACNCVVVGHPTQLSWLKFDWVCNLRSDGLAIASPAPPCCIPSSGQGIVKAGVSPTNITLIDQSPQQLDKARGKADLQGVTILEVRSPGATAAARAGPVHGRMLILLSSPHWLVPAVLAVMHSWLPSCLCTAPVSRPSEPCSLLPERPCRVTPRTCPSPPTALTATSARAASSTGPSRRWALLERAGGVVAGSGKGWGLKGGLGHRRIARHASRWDALLPRVPTLLCPATSLPRSTARHLRGVPGDQARRAGLHDWVSLLAMVPDSCGALLCGVFGAVHGWLPCQPARCWLPASQPVSCRMCRCPPAGPCTPPTPCRAPWRTCGCCFPRRRSTSR